MIDTRVTCLQCMNHRSGWCQRALAAGLSKHRTTAEVGRDFATKPQNCSAHVPRGPR